MQDKTYSLPPAFYADHVMRELPAGVIERETSGRVFVRLNQEEYDELMSDASHYSAAWQFERELFGVCRSAQATVRALVAQGPIEEGTG